MNLYEKLNRLDDSLVESRRVVKKKKLTESTNRVKIEVKYETYGRYGDGGDIKTGRVSGSTEVDALMKMLDHVHMYTDSDYAEEFKEENGRYPTTEEVTDKLYEQNGDGCDLIYWIKNLITGQMIFDGAVEESEPEEWDDDIDEKLTESYSYDEMAEFTSWIQEYRNGELWDAFATEFEAEEDPDIAVVLDWLEMFDETAYYDYTQSDDNYDEIDEMLTEGNNVSSQLPPAIDDFLQDIAQMYGMITYKDIMEHEYTEEDLKNLKNYRRIFKAEIPYEGDEEADKTLKDIANRVAQIVKSKNILESRNNPYFAPYGYRDAAKVLNGKAPEYYYHLKEIEMDRGDGVKLARYAMRKGLPVMVDKHSDPDYPEFAIKGEYHWNDYFYPYPTASEENLVAWDGKMFVEEQLTEAIDPTKAKGIRETSDADVVFYGYQHKTDKPVEVGPEELSYPEFEIKKNQIINSFDKLSQNSSKANRYGKEHDIVFYALYNRKSK